MNKGKQLNGKEAAKAIRREVKTGVNKFETEFGRKPKLSVVLAGEDAASAVYVRNKHRACKKVGLLSETLLCSEKITEDELLDIVDSLNTDETVDGILLQLPLPPQIDADKVIRRIDPAKDVDGFHQENIGKLWLGCYSIVPCTPMGIIQLLDINDIDIAGKRAVIIGRSNIVGKPMAALLLERHATVTLAHSRTRDLPELCRRADILVAAVGRPGLITREYISAGATVIDVGMNHVRKDNAPAHWLQPDSPVKESLETKGFCLVGDVDPVEVRDIAGRYTPVPGGVGPMTIAVLLQNTIQLAFRRMEQ